MFSTVGTVWAALCELGQVKLSADVDLNSRVGEVAASHIRVSRDNKRQEWTRNPSGLSARQANHKIPSGFANFVLL